MKNDEIKNANRKALPKFLLVAVVCAIIGGVIGYYSGHGAAKGGLDQLVGMMKEAGAFFGTHIAPWLMLALAVIVPVVCIPIYRRAKKLVAAWDGEDEDVMQRAEERLSWALLLDSLTVIVSFFFFNAGTAKLPQSSDGNTITLLVIFLVVIALATLLQQKTVDLTKKMNPEKRGSVYDMKFQERWWESCDEAERRQIGQASYKAYTTMNKFCPYCWGVLLLGNMVFHYGILPSAVVLVIWAVLSVSYTREAIRLGRRGQKTE